ncbi:MAG: type VII toxin-antitoxin system HepT family RNase toxin [Candidatus Thorarchaeota archaeon]
MSDAEIESRVLKLQESLNRLERVSTFSREEFMSDFMISDTALRNFQVAIEALTDIANYVLKRRGFAVPETRAGVFERLCDEGLLDGRWREKLVKMARFRNLLVHEYVAIDLSRVYEFLQSEVQFMATVAASLTEHISGNVGGACDS